MLQYATIIIDFVRSALAVLRLKQKHMDFTDILEMIHCFLLTIVIAREILFP